MTRAQVCERLVDSNMSHGVSIKMIIEAFNPSLPAALRALFKPTASIQPPPHALSTLTRPATAATTTAAASSPNSRARDALEDAHSPLTTQGRPGTSYTDAGGTRRFRLFAWFSRLIFRRCRSFRGRFGRAVHAGTNRKAQGVCT